MPTDAIKDLRDDRRGAVLVVAVFMAVFMVGCLWYLVGVGDAAIYREKMQDGSDAVAYASAVYHARGMNIIAVLNLIMAAALAVLIAFKLAEAIAFAVAAIAAVLCPFTGVACGVVAPATDIGTNLQTNVIPRVQNVVNTILQACSQSQVWVARLTPWVGAARGAIAAESYKPTVSGGVALSMSMMPSGDRLGLPVQEAPYDDLCKHAGQMLGNIVFGWIPGLNFLGGILSSLVSTFPGYFCGGSGGGISQQDQAANIKAQCQQAQQSYDQANPNGPPFDEKKCEKDATAQLQKNGGGAGAGAGGLGSSTSGKTSKMVYASAQNGDDYFQVYGLVMGDNASAQKNSKKAVEMPAWGKASIQTNAALDALEKTGFSQAEFYYDQTPAQGSVAWADYKDDAMWNMRWRARLRRFRLPTQVGLDSLAGALGSAPGVPASLQQAGQGWANNVAQGINGAVGTVVIH